MSFPSPRLVRAVFLTEMRSILRDRRAFLMAVVLPMGLFPLLFYGMDRMETASKQSMETRMVRVASDLSALAPELADRVRAELLRPESWIELEEARIDPAPLEEEDWRATATELLDPGQELLLVGSTQEDGPPRLFLVYDGSNSLANEARRRVRASLNELDRSVRTERLVSIAGADPAAELAFTTRDAALAEDAVGSAFGKLLPIVAVLMLISGGSFAALGAFAGEREGGTIETLLVQPASAATVSQGKFLAVLLTACVSLVGNAVSFLFCISMGWTGLSELGPDTGLGLNAGRLLLGLLFFLPTTVFLAALLCLLGARAKSFREGQHYVFPLVIVASVFAVLSTQDRVEAGYLLALIPITGSTLVMRDTLSGAFALGPAIVSFVATSFWSWLALSRLATTLDAERLFRTGDDAAEAAARHIQSRRALQWAVAAVALVYLVGGRLQTSNVVVGLLLTLWVLVPALALLSARGTARRAGESLVGVLGLGRPRVPNVIGALLLAPGLALLVTELFEWQQRILPMPSGFQELDLMEQIGELSPLAVVFLLALTPGFNEELFFRGAILSGLRRDLPAIKVVLWQALLFGAIHASIYRFLPTAFVGAVLAVITLRARRLWPAVALHTTYNALLVLEVLDRSWWRPSVALGLLLPGVLLCLVRPRR